MTEFSNVLASPNGLVVFFLSLFLMACSSNKYDITHKQLTAIQPIYVNSANDGSLYFEDTFCSILKANNGDNCEEYFYIRKSKLDKSESLKRRFIDNDIHIVVIPGIFGECIIEEIAPFQFAIPYITNKYEKVSFSTVTELSGRASSEYNAGIIHSHLNSLDLSENSKVVVLAYSKGVTDTLYYLNKYHTEESRKLDAIVSISGVVNGTFIADYVGTFGDKVGGELPLEDCPTKDDSGISSLTMAKQFEWLAKNEMVFDKGIPMFSLVTASSKDKTSAVFKPFHVYLDSAFGANDGQVNSANQILPKSTVLAVMNADHWAIILPFSDRELAEISIINKIAKSLATKNKFPRKELLESIILTVDTMI